MLVKDYMTRHPIMIPPSMPATDAQKLMLENRVRHLPVIGDGKRPMGLITRERLRIQPTELGSLNVWEITRYLSELKVKDIMVPVKDLLSISPDATLEEAAALQAGEILIAPITDVGWTPYFSLIAGLATDVGSAVSHGAVVAREYGLPAVVNLRVATSRFKTGDMVTLDGDRGTLKLTAAPGV